MKQILGVLVVVLMLAACKKDRNDDPLPEIASIAGKWKLTDIEKTENGKTSWYHAVYYDSPVYLTFRFDGVLLDSNGLPYCCSPDSLKINGVPFKIVPKADLPVNPSCAYLDCATCSTWEITQAGDEMIVGACTTMPKQKFVRE